MNLFWLKQLGIDHSCYPNAVLSIDNVLVALRPIEKDQVITIDYSTLIDKEIIIEKCSCGFNGCRKIIRNYATLPLMIREHYENAGSVTPSFLTRLPQSM